MGSAASPAASVFAAEAIEDWEADGNRRSAASDDTKAALALVSGGDAFAEGAEDG
jgi:hypothetical protein